MHNRYHAQARAAWSQARRKAFWGKLRASLQGQPTKILNFDEVAHTLALRTPLAAGVQEIPVDKIVGSVGRYQDFIDTFLPTNQAMQDRWQAVASLYIDPNSHGAPPIDVFKVGDAYFVSDGNHRVSVANQLGLPTIEARVHDFKVSIYGLADSRSVDAALAETERQAFMAQTRLDQTHSDCDLRLTASGGYQTMLGQILYYQYVLTDIDGEEKSFSEAASIWYHLFYKTTVQIIDEANIMDLFPKRTVADFFIWVTECHHDLEVQYGEQVPMKAAAEDIEQQAHPSLPRRVLHELKKRQKQRNRHS